MNDKYRDMLDMPHHVSSKHAHMPVSERTAQFMPFAALTGYGAAIDETARLTDEKIELSEDEKAVLDEKFSLLAAQIPEKPHVKILYFAEDEKKNGGSYRIYEGNLKKIDRLGGKLVMADGTGIPAADIYDIEL